MTLLGQRYDLERNYLTLANGGLEWGTRHQATAIFCNQENLMRTIAVFLAVVLIASTALAQENAPPPPKPEPDKGPSLEVTMKFIQEKISEQGKVNYAVYCHNFSTNTDETNQVVTEVSNVVADPSSCGIAYHWKFILDGKTAIEHDLRFSLHDAQDLVVRTGEQSQNKDNADGGQPAIKCEVDPPHYVLAARKSGNQENRFTFRDEEMAIRVAKATVHAVELCGGGAKPEPF
jgi:hypothetical protein